MVREHSGNEDWFRPFVREQQRSRMPTPPFMMFDQDLVIHRYRQMVDGVGTRDVQSMLMVEAKHGVGEVTPGQRDSLYLLHQMLAGGENYQHRVLYSQMKGNGNGRPPGGPVALWHFGVAFLYFNNRDPERGDRLWGGGFDGGGSR